MITTSFADLDSPERLRSILAERGYFSTEAPADKLFDLPPDQIGLMQGAQIVALAGPAPDDNTLVVLWVPRLSLPLDVLRRIRRRLAENTRDGLIFCAQSWQKATLYLLRQEDIPQTGQEPPVADRVPFWEVNFSALRPADRQGLAMLDLTEEDPYELGKPLLRAFRRAARETIYQNQGLFSNYYLNERLEVDNDSHNAAWHALAAGMPALRQEIDATLPVGAAGFDPAQTETKVIRPLLKALGWNVEAKSVNGQVDLRLGGSTVAFCHMLAWDMPLDVAPLPGDLLTPSPPSPDMQLIGRLSGQKSVLWGILTNGRTWRLISRQATSTSGVFYEIDLQDLLEVGAPNDRDLRWFAAFFGADWLRAPSGQPGLLDVVYQSGQLWAEKLGNDLKKAIFKDVFVDLANALAEGVRRTGSEPYLPTVYRATLVLLYRLLFVLYAESRRLLPLSSPGYYPNSLTYMLSTLALKQHSLIAKESVFSLQTDDPRLWLKLRALFRAIAMGNTEWNMPHYNGGLFADNTSPAHELLASLDGVANDYLTKGLDRLARDEEARGAETENDVLRLIDYMDLDVRRLGSIYEGLLEFQLRRAEEQGEVIDGQLTPGSAKKGRKNTGRLVQIGEVYLETTRQDRKASGSYYTPDYIVRYIVEQTVGPALEERSISFNQYMDKAHSITTSIKRSSDSATIKGLRERLDAAHEAAFEALLDLKVLDPSMGSGHFLVAAVNYLSDQIIAILQRHPENPVLPRLAQVRAAIRKNLDEQGISGAVIPDEQLSDRVLLRRMVMKRCIYGVDLNDMAVELAKLSLWLDSFAVGAPLSFLDHHLRWGNSLIGVWEVEKSIVQGSGRWNEFMRALGYMVQVTRLTDSTNAEVEESKELYDDAQAALRPFREQFNVDLAVHFATLGDIGRARQIAYQSAEDRAIWDAVTLAKYETAQQEAENRRFFHWKLEFPEAFVDHEHGDWKNNGTAGFDAVVGNPPYLVMEDMPKDDRNYYYFKSTQKQPRFSTATQKSNLFSLFWEQCFKLVLDQRWLSLITPYSWLSNSSFLALRNLFLYQSTLKEVTILPVGVFVGVGIATGITVTQRGDIPNRKDFIFRNLVNIPVPQLPDAILNYNSAKNIPMNSIKETDNLVFDVEWNKNKESLSDKIHGISSNMGDLCLADRGCDTANNQKFTGYRLDKNLNPKKLLLGENFDRFDFFWSGLYLYYLPEEMKLENETARPGDAERFERIPKIIIYRFLNHNKRFTAMFDEDQFYSLGSTYVLAARPNIVLNLRYLLALINSQVMSYYNLALFSGVKVTLTELMRLPIRRIHFIIPEVERKKLVDEIRTQAAALVTDMRGAALGHSTNGWPRFNPAIYHTTALGQRIAALLPQDGQGSFLAFAEGATGAEEHSDVVHDLLADLAGQMIDLNKQKQVEINRFLSWLETQLEITSDKEGRKGIASLPNKITLQNYLGDYQKNEAAQPWDNIYAMLHKHRKRFVNDYWIVGDMFRPQLKAEYEKSLATLLPIKERLARTDALIDQIVYQLYGLTPAEIAVVEGA